jgi:hypothetical protein
MAERLPYDGDDIVSRARRLLEGPEKAHERFVLEGRLQILLAQVPIEGEEKAPL